MAPHLSLAEQDLALSSFTAGQTTSDIFASIAKKRAARSVDMVNITALRRFLRGRSHRRGKVETRGRKRTLTRRNVLAMDAARRRFIKDTKGTRQATWDLVRSKARAPKADRTTVARAFARERMGVKLRRLREKPQRAPEHEQERVDVCGKMLRWPLRRFTDEIDLIMDNKKFDVPTTPTARAYQAKQKLHSQLRTRSEGLCKHYTKPRAGKQRRNLGGKLNVCAGISGGRIVLWEYYTKWNAQVAADMYKGPIMKALLEHRGAKSSYLLAEDNDPVGYKSGLAKTEKRRLGLKTIEWPRYSPDLMPLDFSLWADISTRTAAASPKGKETVKAFSQRLKRFALRTPRATVLAAVGAMKTRTRQIWEAGGKGIARD